MLLITLVILVVLVLVTYRVTGRVVTQRHHLQAEIDYAQATYACDSAVKRSLGYVATLTPILIERPNEPDFSALFSLSDEEYAALLADWEAERAATLGPGDDLDSDWDDGNDPNDARDVNDPNGAFAPGGGQGPDLLVRGPYGPPWPQVIAPLEFEIGRARVRVEVEDENAKYPLTWLLVEDSPQKREITSGFEAFLEWMGYPLADVLAIKEQVAAVAALRPYRLDFEPPAANATPAKPSPVRRQTVAGRITRPTTNSAAAQGPSPAEQAARQAADVTRLLNSSLLDVARLAQPTLESPQRRESALKYIGRWGTQQVNINTAPRHVLEAAFMFGGHSKAVTLADTVIANRRLQPFTDLEDLKKLALGSADAIETCQDYITLTSTHFTVRITVTCGTAVVHAVLAVAKDGDKVRKIAVVSG